MTTSFEAQRSAHTVIAGRYTLGPLIGEPGGQGAVYEAIDTWTDELVAIKIFHSPENLDEHEVDLLRGLDNPNIIRILDVVDVPAEGWKPPTRGLVMERADRSLADEIGPNGMASKKVGEVAGAVVHALQDVHAAGSTHNDVKPSNVLVVDGIYKLADFTTATPLAGTHAYQPWRDSRYAPPERHLNGQVRPEGDIYSLGLMLHEALTGVVPTPAISAKPDARVVAPWRALIIDCLARSPADRPTIDGIRRRLPRQARVVTALRPARTPAPKHLSPPACVVGAVTLLAVLILLYLTGELDGFPKDAGPTSTTGVETATPTTGAEPTPDDPEGNPEATDTSPTVPPAPTAVAPTTVAAQVPVASTTTVASQAAESAAVTPGVCTSTVSYNGHQVTPMPSSWATAPLGEAATLEVHGRRALNPPADVLVVDGSCQTRFVFTVAAGDLRQAAAYVGQAVVFSSPTTNKVSHGYITGRDNHFNLGSV